MRSIAVAPDRALVALRICCTLRVRKSSGPRRAAAEHDTSPPPRQVPFVRPPS